METKRVRIIWINGDIEEIVLLDMEEHKLHYGMFEDGFPRAMFILKSEKPATYINSSLIREIVFLD